MCIEIPPYNAPDSCFEEFWLKCPSIIARGTTRDVYEITDHSDKVLKVSNRQSNFANWSEVVIYTQSDKSIYLAKVFSWSWSGKFLVMEKLTPVTLDDLNGLNFPIYLNDKKPSNFGRDGSGNIKVLDYGVSDFSMCPLIPFP